MVGGANAQDPQGWKRLWGLWGWGLGSRNRRGPGCPPFLVSRGQGTSPGSPAGFLGSSEQGKCPPLLSCSSSLGGPLPPASPDLPGLPPMPPRTHAAWMGVWRAGDWPGSSAGSLCPSGWGNRPPLLPEGPSHLPLLISPASGVPILSGLQFSSPLSPLTSYQFTLGFLPSSWASEFPTSGRQAP